MGKKMVLLIVLLAVGILMAQVPPVEPEEVITNPWIIAIDTLSLAVLLLTAIFAWELYRMMRGGQLATSWGFIAIGIVAFALGKLVDAGAAAGFWEAPEWFDSVVNFVVAVMLAVGVFSQRKVLS